MAKSSDYASKVYKAALALGIPEPQARLAAAQSSLETGYGEHAPGNAYFGIKASSSWDGATQNLVTHEEVGGKRVKITDAFRAYDSPDQSLVDWWNTLQEKWPDAAKATSFDQAVAGLETGVHGAYATDSKYDNKLSYVNRNFLPPRPPMNIPGVASSLSTGSMPLAGAAARPKAPVPFPARRLDYNALPAPAPLRAPSVQVASVDNYVPSKSNFTLPPAVPLNPPMPARPSTSWVGTARPTVQRQPAPVQLPKPAPAAPVLTAAQRSAMSAVPAGTPMTVRPTNTLPSIGALAGGVAGTVPKKVAPLPMSRPAALSTPTAPVVASAVAPPLPVRRPATPIPPQTIPNSPALAAPQTGNVFSNLFSNAQAGIGNAFNTVKTAAAPALSSVGNALMDETVKAALGTKAGRTAIIDGSIAKVMNGQPKPIAPAGKPAGFGSKGYSAAGLALKNQFRRKK